MENLYIETARGRMPIPEDIAEQYHLGKGMLSPFTRSRIVDQNGEFPSGAEMIQQSKEETPMLNEHEGDTVDVMLSTSEVLDFAEGLDSHTEQ